MLGYRRRQGLGRSHQANGTPLGRCSRGRKAGQHGRAIREVKVRQEQERWSTFRKQRTRRTP
jgi:hypothetical protein